MKKLRTLLIEFDPTRSTEALIDEARNIFKDEGYDIEFNIARKFYSPNLSFTSYTYLKDKGYIVTPQWITSNLPSDSKEYDTVIFSFSHDQWYTPQPDNIWCAFYHGKINNVPVITMTQHKDSPLQNIGFSRRVSDYVRILIHELSHCAFDSWMKRPDLDVTHHYDSTTNRNLLTAMRKWNLSTYLSKAEIRANMFLQVFLLRQVVELYKKLVNKDVAPQPKPEPPRSKIEAWGAAIKEFEGWFPGSRSYRQNNPGNLRWSPTEDDNIDNFSVFNTYEKGWHALLFQLTIAADGRSGVYKPTDSLLQFCEKYAPSSDNNHPQNYAKFVAERLGVGIDYQIKNLL